ncbi:MAG: NAD(P)H-dependent oxidoreductase subunit E, partial [Flavobacteriaceae bacterium]|nr:NAD(P)H-dependent oxidoreductase subunit E [Flavobacteriaceae bacterium]
ELAKIFFTDDSVVYGTASFYDFLKPENRNKKVHICNGTACLVARTQENLHHQLEKHFKVDEIGHAACVGRCHENSAFMLDDQVYSADSFEKIKVILNHKSIQENQYHIGCNTTPILTKPIEDIATFYQLIKTYKNSPTAVIDALKTANLRGRGGAGFPFYFKVDAVSKEVNSQKYVVCNADEGDPGAYSDMYLLEHQTHKVLFGMMMTGLIVGANTGVLYIRGEYPDAIRKTQNAIQELIDLNLLNDFKFKIIRGQGAYVCGEETALLNSIEGLRPEVRVRPPFPTQSGLFGKPTLLSNVETFANVHWILENGGKAYANLGTSKSAGTKLVSLDSYFNQPGIYEIEMG